VLFSVIITKMCGCRPTWLCSVYSLSQGS